MGLKSRYRVDVFTGIKLFKSNRASSYQCGYDKAIFPLYRSYEAGNGKELTIDKRQNVLASSRLWWTVAGLLLLSGVSVSFLVRFFTHVQGPAPQVTSPAPSNVAVTMSPSVAVAAPPKPVMSSSWRVAGRLAKAGQVWVLLADNNGRLRAEPVSLFTFEGVMMTGVVAVGGGDIILLGGLAESKLSSANTGFSFLPKGWLTGASDEQNKTDLLVVLQVSKVRR